MPSSSVQTGLSSRLILASASPRRKELLQQLGLSPICLPMDIDEAPDSAESAVALVARLACQKAQQCRNHIEQEGWLASNDVTPEQPQGCVIVGADTVVACQGQIFGKPANREEYLQTLQRLASRTHQVHTGVCVISDRLPEPQPCVVTTDVTFGEISSRDAIHYWNSGEPRGKAGGYAIQGLGALFITRIHGSYSNVVGLPLFETAALLADAGLSVLPVRSSAVN